MSKRSKRRELANSRVPLSFKRHFLPPLIGLMAAFLIFGFFSANLLSGKISYYLLNRQASALTATDNKALPSPISGASQIIVKDLNINAPVNFNATDASPNSILSNEQSGIVHYPGTAMPGHRGDVVLAGLSSNAWWAPGNYKYVFSLLNNIPINDLIYVNYDNQLYTYKVYDAKLVKPTKLTVLNQGSSYMLTLVTAEPIGSGSERLVIRAQQIAPHAETDFTYDKPASQPPVPGGELPGGAGSFWYSLKQLF